MRVVMDSKVIKGGTDVMIMDDDQSVGMEWYERQVDIRPRIGPRAYLQWEKEDRVVRACQRVAEGRSLAYVSVELGLSQVTLYNWVAENPTWRRWLAAARKVKADTVAESIMDMLDDDSLTPQNKAVILKGRTWLASKLDSEQWSDHKYVTTTSKVDGMTDEQLAMRIMDLRQRLAVTVEGEKIPDPIRGLVSEDDPDCYV